MPTKTANAGTEPSLSDVIAETQAAVDQALLREAEHRERGERSGVSEDITERISALENRIGNVERLMLRLSPTIISIARWVDDLRKADGGGGGPPVDHQAGVGDDDAMEARVARLEASVSHIESDVSEIKSDLREIRKEARTDFRIMFGALITATLGLAALMARGFGWL